MVFVGGDRRLWVVRIADNCRTAPDLIRQFTEVIRRVGNLKSGKSCQIDKSQKASPCLVLNPELVFYMLMLHSLPPSAVFNATDNTGGRAAGV